MSSLAGCSDVDLWSLVQSRDFAAFEEIVRRYQNLLCSIAYSRCGDLSTSEDVAQEAFWVAWNSRKSLRDPEKLVNWLSGIVRNLAADATRCKRSRREEAVGENIAEVESCDSDPASVAISREEETIVWDSLEEIPETYREPLILFYREDHSISDVALALNLSEEAVRQRLSRGRTLLKDRVASVVEGALRRTRPTSAFTLAVMAGVTASTTSKSVLASGGVAAASTIASTAAKSALPGFLGGVAGSTLGLLGGYLGLAGPAQMAPTRRERDYLMKSAVRTTVVCLLAVVPFVIASLYQNQFSRKAWTMMVISWICFLNLYIWFEVARITRTVRRIRAETPPEADPNMTPLKSWVQKLSRSYEPRHYRSSWVLGGIPLVHINAPADSAASGLSQPWTVGWLAVGNKARGVIAIGGLAQGIVAIGGVSMGLIAFGGMALGALTLGGCSLGVLALGGGALGWQALGGGAIGWDLAVGGGALARRAAFGGAAFARDYAVGGAVSASHANDDLARQVLAQEHLVHIQEWLTQNQAMFQIVTFACTVVFALVISLVSYRPKSGSSHADP